MQREREKKKNGFVAKDTISPRSLLNSYMPLMSSGKNLVVQNSFERWLS